MVQMWTHVNHLWYQMDVQKEEYALHVKEDTHWQESTPMTYVLMNLHVLAWLASDFLNLPQYVHNLQMFVEGIIFIYIHLRKQIFSNISLP